MAFEKCSKCGYMHYTTDPCRPDGSRSRDGMTLGGHELPITVRVETDSTNPAQAAKPLERVIPQEKAEPDDISMPTPPARSNTPKLVMIGGRTDGVTLYAIEGKDWIGPGYDNSPHRGHSIAWDAVDMLKTKGVSHGMYLVQGSDINPDFSWPIWADFGPAPAAKPKRDRNPYMRQYMVNYRARLKAARVNHIAPTKG